MINVEVMVITLAEGVIGWRVMINVKLMLVNVMVRRIKVMMTTLAEGVMGWRVPSRHTASISV